MSSIDSVKDKESFYIKASPVLTYAALGAVAVGVAAMAAGLVLVKEHECGEPSFSICSSFSVWVLAP